MHAMTPVAALANRSSAEANSARVLVLRHLYAGLAAYVGVSLAVLLYAVNTWGEAPNRPWIALVALAGLAHVPLLLLLRQRIVEARWRLRFFVGWNLASYLTITLLCLLDGGIASPVALLWFMPTVYLSLGYPVRAILKWGAVGLTLYLFSASLTPAPFPHTLALLQFILIADSLLLVLLGAASRKAGATDAGIA